MASSEDRLRQEVLFAVARAFVATTAVLAVYPLREAARPADVVHPLVIAYAAGALAVLVAVRTLRRIPRGAPVTLHLADVCVATTLTLLADSPHSPVFIIFTYVFLVAAYRWGLLATLATGATVVAALSLAAIVGAPDTGLGPHERGLEVERVMMRIIYIAMASALLGYLGAQEADRQHEGALVAMLTRRAQSHPGLHGMLEAVLGSVMDIFSAPRALLTLRESHTGRAFLWTVDRLAGGRVSIGIRELDAGEQARCFDRAGMCAWHMKRRPARTDVLAVDGAGLRVNAPEGAAGLAFASSYGYRDVLSLPLDISRKLTGRVFLLDPHVGFDRRAALRFAHRLAVDITAAACNVHRLRRVRSRAQTLERARIARDLHDGVLQSLCAAELRLDVIRRHVRTASPGDADALDALQAWCRDEARTLRLLTRNMQRRHAHGHRQPEDLAAVVERFQRDTGIAAHFVSDQSAGLPARIRSEVAHIVQEGLINVVKHSGAQHVLVRAATDNGRWKVTIEDDGRGFPFAGIRSHAQLDAMHEGPLVIKERARVLHGRVSVESVPGKGARLEVDVPLRE
jgi:signal transduction histidine kinase